MKNLIMKENEMIALKSLTLSECNYKYKEDGYISDIEEWLREFYF